MSSRLGRAVWGGSPHLRVLLLLVAAGALVLGLIGGGLTPARQFSPRGRPRIAGPSLPSNVVKQGFPAARYDPAEPEKCDTAWEIEWELTHPQNKTWTP